MLNQATKDKLLSLLEIADNSKRYTALAAIEEATEISSDFSNACEKNNWDLDSLKDIGQMIDWVKIQSVPDELDEKQKRVTDELRAYHKNSSIELDDVIVEMAEKETITSPYLSKKIDELLASKTIIKSVTVNDKDIEQLRYNLYLNYPMSKNEAMDLVRTPQSNLTICEFVRKQNPIVREALYTTANRVFFRAVEVAFRLVDAMNAANKI